MPLTRMVTPVHQSTLTWAVGQNSTFLGAQAPQAVAAAVVLLASRCCDTCFEVHYARGGTGHGSGAFIACGAMRRDRLRGQWCAEQMVLS